MDPSGCIGLDSQPDCQHGFGDVLDIVGCDVVPPNEKRACLRQTLPEIPVLANE